MLSTIVRQHFPPLARQIARSTAVPAACTCMRAFSSRTTGWSHMKPCATLEVDTNQITCTATATTTALEKMEKVAWQRRTKRQSQSQLSRSHLPPHKYLHTTSGHVNAERELNDTNKVVEAAVQPSVLVCKVNLDSVWPDFTCTPGGTCSKNYHSGIAVPPVSRDCNQGPCLDLGDDPCLDAAYQGWMDVEPVKMGCKYGRSCPVPPENQ